MAIERQEYEQISARLVNTNMTFFHSPAMWEACNLPVTLNWVSLKFTRSNLASVPDNESGVYAFILKPMLADLPETAYLLYIGKTAEFRSRYDDYLSEQRLTRFIRGRISYMLARLADHLWFYYAPVDQNEMLREVEQDLINTYIPPYNTQLKASVSQAVGAFTRGG